MALASFTCDSPIQYPITHPVRINPELSGLLYYHGELETLKMCHWKTAGGPS